MEKPALVAAAAALAALCSQLASQTQARLNHTAGGARGSADVCSCRAAPARCCMFCRGGEAADTGGLEHVSCQTEFCARSDKTRQEVERGRLASKVVQ